VQRIKIDKAFVDDINGDANSGAIARAVTNMGQSFGMEITAEGVETEEQLVVLRNLGCDEIQGYFFSRPLPDADFEGFMRGFADTAVLTPDSDRRTGDGDRRGGTKAQAAAR